MKKKTTILIMTKQDLQKELKEKVKEGVKPSDLKKLKRSKSADDILSSLTPNPSLPRSKTQLEFQSQLGQELSKNAQLEMGNYSSPYLKYTWYSLVVLCFIWLLNSNWKKTFMNNYE